MKQRCRRCKKNKDLSDFYKDSSNKKTGHVTLCKTCEKKDARRYYKIAKLKKYNLARQKERFTEYDRRVIREWAKKALEGTPSVWQEV